MAKSKRRKMVSFKLDEISAVDKPAQEGAKVAIMKRKSDDTLALQIVKSYLTKLQLDEPIYDGLAKSLNNKEASQAWENLAILESSLHSIVGDSSLSDNDKLSLMKSSVNEFLDYSKTETPNLEASLAKALGLEVVGAKAAKSSEDGDMNLRQLQKQMRDLTGKLDTLLAAQRTHKAADPEDDVEEHDDLLGKADNKGKGKARKAGAMSEEDTAAARLRALLNGEKEAADDGYTAAAPGGGAASMADMGKDGDAEKADGDNEFLENMDGEAEKSDSDEQEEGLVTTTGEEEEPIAAGAASPIGGGSGGKRRADKRQEPSQMTKRVRLHDNDTIVVEGRTFHKAKIGSGLFAILEQQQQRLAKVEKEAREERTARELIEFAKVAETELPNLPGTAEEKAALLKSLSTTLSPEERQLMSKMLRAGNGGLAHAFNTVGTADGGNINKGRGGFEKRIKEIAARDGCKRTEAMQKARREYPEEFAAYQGN